MNYRRQFNKGVCFSLMLSLMATAALHAQTNTVYYALDHVILDDYTQITGIFSWAYDVDDFAKGTGQFVFLDIPGSSHNQDDLITTIDVTESIEITFEGNVHDDGVDIMLVLLERLTPTTPAGINVSTNQSKYSIGGNGFKDGFFLSGSVVPTNITLSITASSPGVASMSWEPDIPGHVLQETPSLLFVTNWRNSASGSTNPVAVPLAVPTMFYRVVKP
jgi:hypothetical protein